jgi:hypothetical protein
VDDRYGTDRLKPFGLLASLKNIRLQAYGLNQAVQNTLKHS